MNISIYRKDFPLLKKTSGKPLVYFDNAAGSLKPDQVVKKIQEYYENYPTNVHRAPYRLADKATAEYESARAKISKFFGAGSPDEIVFTSGTTESINNIVRSLEKIFKKDDEIILSEAEHHSNLVPWQELAKRKKLKLKFIELDSDYRLNFLSFKKQLSSRTRLLAITHASNVTGAITDLSKFLTAARKLGAITVVDAAQSAPHLPIDVHKLNCDFLVASGHKLLGPSGVGIIYGKTEWLEKIEPAKFGGHMIEDVEKLASTYANPPRKFEAGTAPIAQAIGLGSAIDYISAIGSKAIGVTEKNLTSYVLAKLKKIPGLKLLGPWDSQNRLPVFSFVLTDVPAHDLATLLDEENIAVRAGHHCAQLIHKKAEVTASVRASLSFYNTKAEIDRFVFALARAVKIFSR